jgi:hypothetical protein
MFTISTGLKNDFPRVVMTAFIWSLVSSLNAPFGGGMAAVKTEVDTALVNFIFTSVS